MAVQTVVPSQLFPLLHAFLVQNGLKATAQAFIKETKLKTPVASAEPSLLDIYKVYLAHRPSNGKHEETHDDEEEEEEEEEDTKMVVDSKPEIAKGNKAHNDAKKPVVAAVAVAKTTTRAAAAKANAASQQAIEHVEEVKADKKKKAVVATAVAVIEKEEKKPKAKQPVVPVNEESPKPSEPQVGQKRARSDDEEEEQAETSEPNTPSSGKKAKVNVPFKRVRAEEVVFNDERLKDNSFLSKGGALGSYGHKAHNDLIKTRGKGFRHEKTKKKRGSYRGGAIDTAVHSIKFDD